MKLERPSAAEATVQHEAQLRAAMQKQGIASTLRDMELKSVRFYTLEDTKENVKLCAVLHWAIFITGLFRSGAAQYAKKIVTFLRC